MPRAPLRRIAWQYFAGLLVVMVAPSFWGVPSAGAYEQDTDAPERRVTAPGAIPVLQVLGHTYYVATNGNDANPGTSDLPFRTIQKGVDMLLPGDTVYVRGGSYYERVTIDSSGASGAPIVVAGYPGERPFIDGQDVRPGLWTPLVGINGSYVVFRHFEIGNSTGRGVLLWTSTEDSHDVTLSDLWVHHTVNVGIFSHQVDNLTIENSRIWMTSRINDPTFAGYQPEMWDAGIVARRGSHFVLRGNEIFQSYGEGINIHGCASDVVIEDNTLYDIWAPAIYPLNSTTILIQRNLVYHTNDSRFLRGGNPGGGIVLADETAFMEGCPHLSNVTVVNNFVKGFLNNFAFWSGNGGALRDVLVAHNTFVEAHSNVPNPIDAGILLLEGDHSNARFENNLVLQSDPTCDIAYHAGGVTFSHNLWSTSPPANVRGTGDVIGEPRLEQSGPTGSGQLTPAYFRLTAGSPAIDAALSLPSVVEDFFQQPRGATPDIGAHELGSYPSPTFVDVPLDHPYYNEIETLYRAGYTAGCSSNPLMYCPENTMNRAESAVFVERGIHSAAYDPPGPAMQVFADLPLDSWAAKWVNGLWVDQYTSGCGTDPFVYCPWQGHTRAEGCVFYLRMMNGAAYEPPQPSVQTFSDVPLDAWYARWVKAAYDAALLMPCHTLPELMFCPDEPLTRGMAAYMMAQARGLP